MQTADTTNMPGVVTSIDQLPEPDGACRNTTCAAPFRWAVTSSGKRMPVDAEPSEDGTVILEVLDEVHPRKQVQLRAMVIGPMDQVADDVLRFRSHFATCPAAGKFRTDRRS